MAYDGLGKVRTKQMHLNARNRKPQRWILNPLYAPNNLTQQARISDFARALSHAERILRRQRERIQTPLDKVTDMLHNTQFAPCEPGGSPFRV